MKSTPAINWKVFLPLWITVTTASLVVVGVMFHYPFGFALGDTYTGKFDASAGVFGFILSAISGALLVGIPQWLIIRRHIRRAAWWIASVAVALGVMHGLGDAMQYSAGLIAAVTVGGVVASVWQGMLLRDQLNQPIAWIFIVFAAWVVGYFAGMQVLDLSGLLRRAWTSDLGAMQHALFGAVHGLIVASASGLALMRLSRPRTTTHSQMMMPTADE